MESSGANNFFTLVRYNPPELLEDYNYFKKLEKMKKATDDDGIQSTSTINEDEETAEDIIFTLFGPRVWLHNGEALHSHIVHMVVVVVVRKVGSVLVVMVDVLMVLV